MHDSTSLSRGRVHSIFGGLLLAMLLGSLDQTIVSTALPTIVGDLGGFDQLSWVVTAYLLTATVSTPLTAEPARNTRIAACMSRLRPKRSLTRPHRGVETVAVSR